METKSTLSISSEFQFCMHACGSIYNLMFTNTLEALEYWYNQGIKLFEVDISDAGNGKFVACHDFTKKTFEKMEIEELPDQCTYEWFIKQKLFNKTTNGLTPLTLETIFQLLSKYKDVIFMIDPKVYSYDEVCSLLFAIKYFIDKFEIEGERIIFETYTKDMILATREYKGVVQYQFCVEDERQDGDDDRIRKWELEKLIRFLKENDIWILSYPWKYAVESLHNLKKLRNENFLIFSRTKNDIISELLKQAGVNVNIIDYLVTDIQREELKGFKKDYYKKYKSKIDKVFSERT